MYETGWRVRENMQNSPNTPCTRLVGDFWFFSNQSRTWSVWRILNFLQSIQTTACTWMIVAFGRFNFCSNCSNHFVYVGVWIDWRIFLLQLEVLLNWIFWFDLVFLLSFLVSLENKWIGWWLFDCNFEIWTRIVVF